MSQLGTVYATKRRRRNGKSLKPQPKDGVTKSNPSKRHRERLNAELDLLASLLPFEQNILSKLDRLSILRLSVSYLRTKSYFQVVMHKDKDENGMLSHIHSHDAYRSRELGILEHSLLDGDMFLQALNGFLMILTCDGEVFFATHSIESYLGFHQSDIVHQSVYELVHSEDREELQRQLHWNSFLPQDMSGLSLSESLSLDKSQFLERSFTVRFRCLLDNTSGFLRLDIRGRVKILHGQNRKTEEPPLALFAYCTPFGPPSLLEIPQKENMFKSKHKLDLSLVSMDQRGKHVLGFSDAELASMGGYDLVHFDDLAYVASAHQELLKTGASGMIAYRFQKKGGEWQWLQTSSRLVYKNSKPDFVISTHRQLMEEEGRDLLGKRTMDFKVSYLDTGLSSTYFSEADQIHVPPTASPNSLGASSQPSSGTPQRANRRYKTQLRDFLSTCQKTKRGRNQSQANVVNPLPPTPSPSVVDYIPDSAVAVAAAYSNLNPMYSATPYAPTADNIYMTSSVHSSNFYPVTENLFHQYRVSGYYPEYHHHHHNSAPTASSPYMSSNGFLAYENYGITASKDDKWQDSAVAAAAAGKYYPGPDRNHVYSGYGSPASLASAQIIQSSLKTPKSSPSLIDSATTPASSQSSSSAVNSVCGLPPGSGGGVRSPVTVLGGGGGGGGGGSESNDALIVAPKVEHSPQQQQSLQAADHYEPQRQTVLMWGSTQQQQQQTHLASTSRSHSATAAAAAATTPVPRNSNSSNSIRSPSATPTGIVAGGGGGPSVANGGGAYGGQEYKANSTNGASRLANHNNHVLSPEQLHSHHHHQQQLHMGPPGGAHSLHHHHHSHLQQQQQQQEAKWNGIVGGYHKTSYYGDGRRGGGGGGGAGSAVEGALDHQAAQATYLEHHHHHGHQAEVIKMNGTGGGGGAGGGGSGGGIVGESGEVWSPASASYSQYQYFTYHNAPTHPPSTQSSSRDTSPAGLRNGYSHMVDSPLHHPHAHHPHLRAHHPLAAPSSSSTITTDSSSSNSSSLLSPMSPRSQHLHVPQPQHHHHHHPQVARSPIPTRTGVLCCPSLR